MTQLIEGTIPETGEVVQVIVETQGGALQPIAPPDEIPQLMHDFHAAIEAVVLPEYKGYIGKDGVMHDTPASGRKTYYKAEAWQALAYHFGISLECSDPVRQVCENGETYYVYRSTCKAIAPNGRFVQTVGCCSSKDAFFTRGGKKTADEADISNKSQTVAMNRAIARLLGMTGELPDPDPGDGKKKPAETKASAAAEAFGETHAQAKIRAVKELKKIMTVPDPFSPSELARMIKELDNTDTDCDAVIARAQAERDKRMQKGAA